MLLVAGMLLLAVQPLFAQRYVGTAEHEYTRERSLIESVLQTVVTVLQEATFQNTDRAISDQLRQMTLQLSDAREQYQPLPAGDTAPAALSEDDLRRLEAMLRDLHRQLVDLRNELEAEQNYELANRVAPVERGLYDAVETVATLARDEADAPVARAEGERWLKPGRYTDEGYERTRRYDRDAEEDTAEAMDDVREDVREAREEVRKSIAEAREEMRESFRRKRDRDDGRRDRKDDWDHDDEWDKDDRWHRRYDRHSYVTTHFGDYAYDWPFAETALYRPVPAIRYNRVEGLVLGVGLPPVRWDDYDRNRIYGQVGYAFALDAWRYEVGLETRPLPRDYHSDFALKLGGNYHRNTTTDDLWKSGWIENSLAAFFFKNDFFDYYEVEGWTGYAVQQLTPYAQLSAGFRSDEYRSLAKNTSWAVFGGDGFRLNPAVDEGQMYSFAFALEGGRIRGLDYLPRGVAFRTEVELGQGLGGDFSFNRYLGDVRTYLPLTRYSAFSFRLRGGVVEGDAVPVQKAFTLGGVGSVRGYPQNAFFGTRMLLGNVEYAVNEVSIFDDVLDGIQLFGFADAGWVNDMGTDRFDFDDVIPAAGFGIGLDDRYVRLELAWPLRDVGGFESGGPSFWLRLNPTF